MMPFFHLNEIKNLLLRKSKIHIQSFGVGHRKKEGIDLNIVICIEEKKPEKGKKCVQFRFFSSTFPLFLSKKRREKKRKRKI